MRRKINPPKRLVDPGQEHYLRIVMNTDIVGKCWIWKGYKDPNGYGQIRVAGRTLWVHRVTYACYYGEVPAMQLDHKCNNPSCVNPKHLKPVTISANVARANKRRAGIEEETPF